MEFLHPQPKFCSNTLKMSNINCIKKLNKSCQQESVLLGVSGSPLGKTRKKTLSCWQLLFNFFPQLMFDIFKVLEQNLSCGCENSITYYRAGTPQRASHVICSELPGFYEGFYRFLTKKFSIQPLYNIIPFKSLCCKVNTVIFFIFLLPCITHRKMTKTTFFAFLKCLLLFYGKIMHPMKKSHRIFSS